MIALSLFKQSLELNKTDNYETYNQLSKLLIDLGDLK